MPPPPSDAIEAESQLVTDDAGPSQTSQKSPASNARKTKSVTVDGWGYDWLEYESRDGLVTEVWCTACRSHHDDRNTQQYIHSGQAQICDLDAYVVGTSNVKKDTAKSHSISKSHLAALKAKKTPNKDSVMIQQLQAMNAGTKEKMCKLFDIAYTIAYCELPFTMYKTLVSVERKHGVQLGSTYCNAIACRSFIGHIGGNMIEKLQELFREDTFYCSLLFDGSSDKSQSEKEVISIKLIENGVPKIKLLG